MEAEVATPFVLASSSWSSTTSSSSPSSSSERTSKKWIFLKDLLYRSKRGKRERRIPKEKFWHSISFSQSKAKTKPPPPTPPSTTVGSAVASSSSTSAIWEAEKAKSKNSPPLSCRSSKRTVAKPVNGLGCRRGPALSLHDRHTRRTERRQRRCGGRRSYPTTRTSSATWASAPAAMAPLIASPIHFTLPHLGKPHHLSSIIPTLIETVPIINVVIDVDEVPLLGYASMAERNRRSPLGERIGPAPTHGPPGMLDVNDNGVEGDQTTVGEAKKEEEEKRSLKRRRGPPGARERRTRRSRSRVT